MGAHGTVAVKEKFGPARRSWGTGTWGQIKGNNRVSMH